MKQIMLAEAVKTGKLEEFARQQELAGVGPVDKERLDRLLNESIKAPRLGRQTSRSRYAGGSRDK